MALLVSYQIGIVVVVVVAAAVVVVEEEAVAVYPIRQALYFGYRMVTVAMADLKSRRWREGYQEEEEVMGVALTILQTLSFDFGYRMVTVAMRDLKSRRWREGCQEEEEAMETA